MESNLKELFGARVAELRKKHHLSQQQLADLIGFKLIGISQIERGVKFASERTIKKLCAAFSCEPKDLFAFEVKRMLTQEEKTALADIKALLENHPEYIKDTLAFVSEKINNGNNRKS
uniref:helix-turn-helix domain-containing protein n=1 Tax=Candidatus Scatousia sp. TaxID=3085663 RepID=UPI004027AB64